MRSRVKNRSGKRRGKVRHNLRKVTNVSAAVVIRRIGEEWARHWNMGELDEVVAAYSEDAVYLPPHHGAIHGREAIREYLKIPLGHGVSDLAFEVTYIKQQGPIAWDVGIYRMSVAQSDGTEKEDHGKYLTLWRRVGKTWLIAADAWSSDLPPAA